MSKKRKVVLELLLVVIGLCLCGCSSLNNVEIYHEDGSAEILYSQDFEYDNKEELKGYFNLSSNVANIYNDDNLLVFKGYERYNQDNYSFYFRNMYNEKTGKRYTKYDVEAIGSGFKKIDELNNYYNAEYDVYTYYLSHYPDFYSHRCVTYITDNTATVIIQMIDMKPTMVWLNALYNHCNDFIEFSGLNGFYLNIDGERILLDTENHKDFKLGDLNYFTWEYQYNYFIKEVPVTLDVLEKMINAESVSIEVFNGLGDFMEVRDLKDTSSAVFDLIASWRQYEEEYRCLVDYFADQKIGESLQDIILDSFNNHGISFTTYDYKMAIKGQNIMWEPFAIANNPRIRNEFIFGDSNLVLLEAEEGIYPINLDSSGATPLPLDLISKLINGEDLILYKDEAHYISGDGTEFKLSYYDRLILRLAQEVLR